jgi:hypothetical protein
MTTKEINDRIEAMLIAKIASHRLDIRMHFKNRHTVAWPELKYNTITGYINTLKVWMQMAKLIEKAYNGFVPSEPYTTYTAKKLTHDTTRT